MAKYEARVASQKETFDSYNAEYRPLLDDYLLRRVGKYIVYCVSDDAKAASAALDEFLG